MINNSHGVYLTMFCFYKIHMNFSMLTERNHYVNIVFLFRLCYYEPLNYWQLVILQNVCVYHNLNLVFGVFLFCSTPEPCGHKLRINFIFWLRTLFRYIYIWKQIRILHILSLLMLIKPLYFCPIAHNAKL